MHARLLLDIGWRDLASGLAACALARGPERRMRRVEALFSPRGDALATLSVRSGLDLYLQALALSPGSEVLVSSLTIPHMVAIVEAHRLRVVPFALDPRTLGPASGELERLATLRTRAVLFAHLFGQRADLGALVALARKRGWLVWEDCAQAHDGDGWRGHEQADLALFSFGLIKNATAVGGALARVRDPELRARMRAIQATRSVQPRAEFARKLRKAALLKLVSHPVLFARFARSCARRGRDLDQVLHGATRSFPGPDLFALLRRVPSAPLLALLERRLQNPARSLARARRAAGEALLDALGGALEVYGSVAPTRTHWVFAVGVDEPEPLVRELRAAGFDATHLSSLVAVRPTAGGEAPDAARELLERVVYVPLVPELEPRRRDELVRILVHSGGVIIRPHPPRHRGGARTRLSSRSRSRSA